MAGRPHVDDLVTSRRVPPEPTGKGHNRVCRKCGETDRRGSARARRRSRARLLAGEAGLGGNGVITVCVWCLTLLSDTGDARLEVTDHSGNRHYLPVERLERDRLGGHGTPYALWNLVPACGPCNRRRTYEQLKIPEGCAFGPETSVDETSTVVQDR